MTGQHRDPCPNEALTEFGLCLRHLREAAGEWQRVRDAAAAQFPSARKVLGEAA